MPYTDSTMRSIYHVRDFETYRLLQLQQHTDIFLSHDWPLNVAWQGDTQVGYRVQGDTQVGCRGQGDTQVEGWGAQGSGGAGGHAGGGCRGAGFKI